MRLIPQALVTLLTAHVVPWDATKYDVLIPANPGNLLYMRGQLFFFKAGPLTEAKINQYQALADVNSYCIIER